MGERYSEYSRASADWYVEPAWCADDIFQRLQFTGSIHDPCCGIGTIVDAAARVDIVATGKDIKSRDLNRFAKANFLQDAETYQNIVTNPPYRLAHRMAVRALHKTARGGYVAFLTQLKFLASQRRFPLWQQVERVIIYSRRPSMPPGELLLEEGEACRGGGSIDFCWIVWMVGYEGPATIEWSLGTSDLRVQQWRSGNA